ncbi:MAG: YcaO-related McrA-glycine thioamidation protein [Candidatus Methanofastidiosa archaeon]|nr:YcaO-related McrA-glycine thioamidation protein [Candidatus Methanofastidiosa archaeon]
MELHRCRKRYTNSTHRVKTPEETYDLVKDTMPSVGVTETLDITDLDRVGIPVFISKRVETDTGRQMIHNGKGFSTIESIVSAMMESIERHCSSFEAGLVTVSPAISLDSRYIDPVDLVLPNPVLYSERLPLSWCRGAELMHRGDVLVAANAVFHPFPQGPGWLFRSNTNGLACGNCLEEAILHALCEVIERDAWSLAELSNSAPNDVILDTDDPHINWVLDRFNDAEVEITIKDITSDIGLPTFFAVSDDVRDKDPTLLNMGVGTHLSPKVALIRALTEVAQSRLSQIYQNKTNPSGSILKQRLGYDKIKAMNKKWIQRSKSVSFSEFESFDTQFLLDDIEVVLSMLSGKGFENACVVDLTREAIGVPVVRVVVPGLEQSSVDRDRVGKRARSIIT